MIRAALLALCLAPTASAQTLDIPRTREGRPDFQGVWDAPWVTPIERPANAASLVVSAEEAETIAKQRRNGPFANALNVPSPIDYTDKLKLTRVDGEYRTSQIIDTPDGKLPFTEAGRTIARWVPAYDDPETIQLQSRCIIAAGAPPMFVMPAETVRQIVQTPREVVVYSESMNDLRIIAISGRHRPKTMISAQGDSVGWWEGDTLTVETTHFRDDMAYRSIAASRLILAAETKVIERFTFVGPDEIVYRFTVQDPVVYTQVWTGEYTMVRIPGRAYETACHEGNYAVPNMLRGARMAEQRPVKAAPSTRDKR